MVAWLDPDLPESEVSTNWEVTAIDDDGHYLNRNEDTVVHIRDADTHFGHTEVFMRELL